MDIQNRKVHRVRTSVRIAFVGFTQDFEGEAHTLDLSFSGCRAICRHPPPKGTKLQVSLYLPGVDHPVSIALAMIRWVRKALIGIEFYSIPPSHRQQLQAWILKSPYGRSENTMKAQRVAL
jgi:PilZ domain-containing protein